jgi:lipoprotein-anchoring transpeptidase ErfK/SrfK
VSINKTNIRLIFSKDISGQKLPDFFTFLFLIGCLTFTSLNTGATPTESSAFANKFAALKKKDHYIKNLSVEIIPNRLLIRRLPTIKSKRRGLAVGGSRLPVYETREGPGCNNSIWYKVHKDGWVCGKYVRLKQTPPAAIKQPVVKNEKSTPWSYAFVREPAMEYRFKGGIFEEVREVFKGFGFGVEKFVTIDGQSYFKSPEGRYIPRYAAGITGRISKYKGVEITNGSPWPIGWVNSKKAFAYKKPSRQKKDRIGLAKRYTLFEVLETRKINNRIFYRFDNDAWFNKKDVRVVQKATRPASTGPDEKWIDVDIAQQIITAYTGDNPVYAALVSTGRAGRASRTVKGEYRIWAKIAAIAMDNTDEELDEEETNEQPDTAGEESTENQERKLFSLHDVPWTQFFFENYALHGVYWHDRFGNRKSHGCVNLAPKDAHWFFDWTEPKLPDGWWAIHSVAKDNATVVRVR